MKKKIWATAAIAASFLFQNLGFAADPGGHPKSPSCGHLKIPQLAA